MRKVVNETTGIEEMQFGGRLLSVSEKVLTNVNGKNYKVGTIEFKDIAEKQQRCTALVYEGNYKNGIKVGETYLCTATPTDQGVIVKMSHLTYNGDRASADMFGFEVVEETTNSAQGIKANVAFDSEV